MDIAPIVAVVTRDYGDPPGSGVSQRRNVLLAALLLVAAALVGLLIGYLVSRAGSGSDGVAAPLTTSSGSAASSSSATATPSRPKGPSGSEIEKGLTRDLGYFLGATRDPDGLTHVSFDRVQLLRGNAAEKYAEVHGGDSEAARSGLIVNENPRTRDLVLAPDVKILGGVQLAASSDPEPVPLKTLLDALDSKGSDIPLELRYDKLGYVVQVTEKRYA
jgi:hypothetical protein